MSATSAKETSADFPRVSVVIPAYNAGRYVGAAIRGILEQHYPDAEILLIDDGSKDSTVELVRERFPMVRILQQANTGAAAARNTGMRAASGELVCFLDADDGWFPGKLAAQVTYLKQHPEVGVVYHRWLVWRTDTPDAGDWPKPPPKLDTESADPEFSGWIYPRLLLDCIVHTSTVMMRRQVIDAVGFFDTTLVTGEDYDYWLRVSRHTEIHKLRGTYSFYRLAPGSLTTGAPKSSNNEYNVITRALEKWGPASPVDIAASAQAISNRLYKLAFDFGYAHFHQGSPVLARQAFRQALTHDAGRARAWLYWLASLLKSLGSKTW